MHLLDQSGLPQQSERIKYNAVKIGQFVTKNEYKLAAVEAAKPPTYVHELAHVRAVERVYLLGFKIGPNLLSGTRCSQIM